MRYVVVDACRWIAWAIVRVGYEVRPYDMIADSRRWFWQPREQCQWSQREHE